ncbi:MAG: glycosyltransferase family 1 protein [bacterium]
MKIGIEARFILKERSGIGVYASKLIQYLKKIDSGNEYVIFNDPQPSIFSLEKIRPRSFRKLVYLFWLNSAFQYTCNQYQLDILHLPNYIAPLVKSRKYIITIHDLTYLKFPESMIKRYRLYMGFLVPLSAKLADYIVTDSQSSKKDIIDYLNVPEEKIEVVYPGVEQEDYTYNYDPGTRKQEPLISSNYLLFVSTIEPRKNLERLIKAFDELKREKACDLDLVIVGKRGWLDETIKKAWHNSPYQKDIKFLGYVDQKTLNMIYRKAFCLVFPSIYEGFGFPILEAMANYCPVLASNTSSIPEIVADAALLFDPFSVEAIARAIKHLIDNKNLREELILKGRKRVKNFSWEKTAREMVRVYKKVIH